jgi:hypothetical protein
MCRSIQSSQTRGTGAVVTCPGSAAQTSQGAAFGPCSCFIFFDDICPQLRQTTTLDIGNPQHYAQFKTAYRTPDSPIERRHLDLYSGYVHDFNPAHAKLVNEHILKETTLTGTPEELLARVERMRKAGVKQIAVHGGTRAGAAKVIADFSKYVIAGRKR